MVRPAPTDPTRLLARGAFRSPIWTIGRAHVRESQIPEWQEKQKKQNGLQDGAQANDVVTGKQLDDSA